MAFGVTMISQCLVTDKSSCSSQSTLHPTQQSYIEPYLKMLMKTTITFLLNAADRILTSNGCWPDEAARARSQLLTARLLHSSKRPPLLLAPLFWCHSFPEANHIRHATDGCTLWLP